MILNKKGLVLLPKLPERSLEEAKSEHATLGSHIGLTERLCTNLELLESMCTPDSLAIERFRIGKYTNTDVALIYMPSLASNDTVDDIRKQIESMTDYNYLPHIHGIESKLRPAGTIIYSTSKLSERFGELSTDLMQGKIAVISDHTPYALVLPLTFWEHFQSPDDYFSEYGKYTMRLIRMLAFACSILIPAIYLIMAYHTPDYLPKRLFNNKEILPTFWEQLILITFWRITIDSAVRVHQQLSIMLTILLAVVVGENLIATHIVNADGVAIVALSMVFAFAAVNEALKPLIAFGRYAALIVAWLWGYTGLFCFCTVLFLYGCMLRPYGLQFMFPLIPFNLRGFIDTFIRGNIKRLWSGKHRL